jgi:hypothetical protein
MRNQETKASAMGWCHFLDRLNELTEEADAAHRESD